MCAIVDANVVSEVFGTNPSEAGMRFLLWVEKNVNGRLVVGGKLLGELYDSSLGFRGWAQQAQLSGNMRLTNEDQVNMREEELRKASEYVSDDPLQLQTCVLASISHVIPDSYAYGAKQLRNRRWSPGSLQMPS